MLIKFKQICLSITLAFLALILTWTTLAHAGEPGDLDTSFGGTGVVTTSVSPDIDSAFSVIIQSDGKIVLGGTSTKNTPNRKVFALVRYTITGSLDTTFNNTGIVTTAIGDSDWAYSTAIQSDGKLAMAGFNCVEPTIWKCNMAVVRYTVTGTLDTEFNSIGVITTTLSEGLSNHSEQLQALALQPDGKIVVGGVTQQPSFPNSLVLVRYTITGALDSTFNNTGIVTTSFWENVYMGFDRTLTIQPDGKIIVVGQTRGIVIGTLVARYTTTGTLDSTFNGTGAISSSDLLGNSVALQENGKIVVAGEGVSNGDFAVARYYPDGALDTNFGGTGLVTTSVGPYFHSANSVAIQPDGKIVVAGYIHHDDPLLGEARDIAVLRYHKNGALDTTFHNDGIVTTSLFFASNEGTSVALQPDGNIVVAGITCDNSSNCDFVAVRYLGKFTAYLPIILKEL